MPRKAAKVLFCEGNFDGTIGGSYFSLLFLTEGLDRKRFDPLVIFRRETPMLTRFADAGITARVLPRPEPIRIPGRDSSLCRRFPALCAPLGWAQSAANLFKFCGTVLGLARLMRRERADIVHLNNATVRTHDWMLAALLTGTPCLTHERGINDYFSRMTRWLAPKLDAIICISAAVRDNLIAKGVSRDNVVLIPNGLDPSKVVPARSAIEVRQAYGIPADSQVIGLVGNLRAWKGQEVVVRAMAEIVAALPNVTCLFIGEAAAADEPFVSRLRSLITELGLERNIVFTGYCTNVADFFNVMDVAVHASISPEPFGRVLLEAMAMKRAIVGSRGGAVTEIVEEGETGYTVTPGSHQELASRVIELLSHPERARAFGEAGYRRLNADFHIVRNVDLTMALYDKILGRKDSTPAV